VVEMKPWTYDHNCLVLPWREVDLSQRPLKWGVMWEDGVIAPSPACKRALQLVVDQLRKNGHEIASIDPPSAYEGTKIASQLLLSDEAKVLTKPIRFWEWCDTGIQQVRKWFNTPCFLKKVYIWYIRYIRKDQIHAGFLEGL
ncbi:hypothetical protein MPER_15034, partial [Moniliophthora perniciosa FA553]